MNAESHLRALGWLGPGHPLHPQSYNSRHNQKGSRRGLDYDPNTKNAAQGINGLIRPILASKKDDTLGLGRRKHEPVGGSEWWVKGFEKALGNVGSGSERSSGVVTPVGGGVGGEVVDGGGKFGALYSFFVSGGEMAGTVEEEEEGGARGEKREGKKVQEEFGEVAEFMAVRDKDEKRRRRKEKVRTTEEFRRIGEFMEIVEGKRRSSKKRKSDVDEGNEVRHQSHDGEGKSKKRKSQVEPLVEVENGVVHKPREETKEERRERRQQRKDEKEAKRSYPTAATSQSNGHSKGQSSEAEAASALGHRREEEAEGGEAGSGGCCLSLLGLETGVALVDLKH